MKREAWFGLFAAFTLLAVFAVTAEAQPEKAKADAPAEQARRSSLLEDFTGLVRPGNPSDEVATTGEIKPAVSFAAEGLKKFKVMGATVWFAVFKNIGETDGDTFGTGMTNFDHQFREGSSFQGSFSPKYDSRAKYLYLYQVVNDRGLERAEKAKGGGITTAIGGVQKDGSVIPTEDIGSFSLKLIVDPLYITSWGHFNNSGFASKVAEVEIEKGKIKTVVAGEKKEDKMIRLAASYHPSIQTKIQRPAYLQRAQSQELHDLAKGFGVASANTGLKETAVHQDLQKQQATMLANKLVPAAHIPSRLQAAETAYSPDHVQLISMSNEERAEVLSAVGDPNLAYEELTRAIFRVDWNKNNTVTQGGHSVVFGFTTDLPPTRAPIRIDTPKAARFSEGLRLSTYFADSGVERATGVSAKSAKADVAPPPNRTAAAAAALAVVFGLTTDQPLVVPNDAEHLVGAVGAEGAAAALALGTALGQQVPTPVPPPAEVGAGFAGVTGGVNSFGGVAPSGGGGGLGGGLAIPALGGIGGARGVTGGGGGGLVGGGGQTDSNGSTDGKGDVTVNATGDGSGEGGGDPRSGETPSVFNFNNDPPVININVTLTNQQQQQQQQQQSQTNGGDCCCSCPGDGHVVPAPASLLLGLLGLPGLFFLRRRTNESPANA